ncbi:uncharacterized protein [Euwallacea fornicatus]|uniref:uncharacterized protein isoform X2 n=1 Tax=Euwallacea fornicatus TaxID=995702 RepID=UPI00339028CE
MSSSFVKFLSSTVDVRIRSQPNLAIEILLCIAVCIVHFLLIIEINTTVRRTNAKAEARLRKKYPIKEIEDSSSHSLIAMKADTQTFHNKPDIYERIRKIYNVMNPSGRFCSEGNNFGWAQSKGDSRMKHRFLERVEHLLSITPSEYVRRDRESREQRLRSPFTPLLKRALSSEENDCNVTAKTDIHRNLNTLKENIELRSANAQITCLASASLEKLMEQAAPTHVLKTPEFDPKQLMASMIWCPYLRSSKSKCDTRARGRSHNEEDDEEVCCFALKSRDSLTEICGKKSTVLHERQEGSPHQLKICIEE